jgi:uncharacterized membrane protein
MKQNVPFSSRIQFPSVTGFEIGLLVLSIIIGIILLSYSQNIILKSFYIFIIFIPIGMSMRNIKSALSSEMLSAAFILIGVNFGISILAYYIASIGFVLYFIILYHRYCIYKKLTGG